MRALVEREHLERPAVDAREADTLADPSFLRLDDPASGARFSKAAESPTGAANTWEFDAGPQGWTLADGDTPAIRDGRLEWTVGQGREGLVSPVLDLPVGNTVTVEVRFSASAGERLRLWWLSTGQLSAREEADNGGLLGRLAFWRSPEGPFDTPDFSVAAEVHPGPDIRRFLIRTPPLAAGGGQRLARIRIDPTDGDAAEVAVESIRIVGPEDAYAGLDHGIGQEALGGEIRHVLFHRVPSEISWDIRVPSGARLDAGAGLLDARDGVTIEAAIVADGVRTPLLRERLVTDDGWSDLRADLSAWAGRSVELVLSADSPHPGQMILWSNPMVVGRRKTPPSGSGATTERPDVLLYLIDTLRADRLGAYGNEAPTSPAIDRLAAEGVLFERCSSAAPWTRPSVASLLTSLPPPAHGATDYGLGVSDAVVTLAEQMRQAGYVTAAFVTTIHAGSSVNLQQGFDFVFESSAIRRISGIGMPPGPKDFSYMTSSQINRVIDDWLPRYADVPLFLYIHSMDPHAPYVPREPYDRMFDSGYAGSLDGWIGGDTSFENARTPLEIGHVKSLYDADIRDNDDRIGELLDRLEELGILDRTLFVLTSDHGEEFFEHGGFQHGQSLHRELLQVPLVMRLPGVLPQGLRVSSRVRSLDVMPTVLSIAGIEANPDARGRDLTPLLTGAAPRGADGAPLSPRDIFAWRYDRYSGEVISVSRGDWKAIIGPGGRTRLYDQSVDPLEQHDISDEHVELTQELAAAGTAWSASLRRIVSPSESSGVLLDPEQREWLESLGYVK